LKLVTALAGVLCIATIGQTLVVSTGGLDITVAPVMTLGGALVVRESQGQNGQLLQAMIWVLVAGLAIGLLSGLLVVLLRLNPLIVTLAMSSVITGGLMLWTGVSFSQSGTVPLNLEHFATKALGPVDSIALVACVLSLLVSLTIYRTGAGRAFLAVGVSSAAARILGIRVNTYRIGAYAIGGLLYSLAGALLAGYLVTPDYTLGSPYLLLTFVAVALAGTPLTGGPASLLCTLGSCFFLALLDEYLAVKGLSGGVEALIQGVVLVMAVGALRSGDVARNLIRKFSHITDHDSAIEGNPAQ
jgi:ribose transport system permease protein